MDEESIVTAAVRAGAFGLMRKSVSIEVVVQSIRAAAQGQVQFSPAAIALLVGDVHTPTESPERLTAREFEVLQFVADGLVCNLNGSLVELLFRWTWCAALQRTGTVTPGALDRR